MTTEERLDKELIALTEPYDKCQLECDGLTRVLHTVLTRAHIEHSVYLGTLTRCRDGKVVAPHYWIVAQGITIDYRARMWTGEEAPHGVFVADECSTVKYDGNATSMPMLSDELFEILTTRIDWAAIQKGVDEDTA